MGKNNVCKHYYLMDSRSQVGTNVVFWNKGGCGYGTNIDNLEIYSQEKAQKMNNARDTDIPLLKDVVDSLCEVHVDSQYLPNNEQTSFKDGVEYIGVVKNKWNGNDIAFYCIDKENNGMFVSFGYDEAYVLSKGDIESLNAIDTINLSFYKKGCLDKVSRRTIQIEYINKRKMCKGVKLKRQKRKSQAGGKVRGNCHECGKLVWAYQHYESRFSCMEHKY